jgi:hypothetical protein
MTKCMVCGGTYRDMLVIQYRGQEQAFDCFECAVHALAPHCALCGCKVIGHGIDEGGRIYCCRHCAATAAEGGVEGSAVRREREREGEHDRGSHEMPAKRAAKRP